MGGRELEKAYVIRILNAATRIQVITAALKTIVWSITSPDMVGFLGSQGPKFLYKFLFDELVILFISTLTYQLRNC